MEICFLSFVGVLMDTTMKLQPRQKIVIVLEKIMNGKYNLKVL